MAIVTSSFKIVLTNTFTLRGATHNVLSSRPMLFDVVYFGLSINITLSIILQFLIRNFYFYNGERYYLYWLFGMLCFGSFI